MDPSMAPTSAASMLPAVHLYWGGTKTARRGHEIDTLHELARQIAELKGMPFSGEYDKRCAHPGPHYWVPDDTLTLAEAHTLGVRSARDLYGGVVPFPFVATKLIAHGLPVGATAAPQGWSNAFSEQTASLVLPGYAAFSREDARAAGRALLASGPVRVKRADGIGGAGQAMVETPDQLEAELDALSDAMLRLQGIVIERHLNAIETFSAGQVLFDNITASYFGVQHLTVNNHGHQVYGGTDLLVVRGDFDALARLPLSEDGREAIAKARAFDTAVQNGYAGFFASRRNYDVAHGIDEAGKRCCGVLDQSWRVGGATGAEIGALRLFITEPDAHVVHASTHEVYGEDVQLPAGACLLYEGVDARVGKITKYYTVDSDTVQRSSHP